jgi:hypothetical protein
MEIAQGCFARRMVGLWWLMMRFLRDGEVLTSSAEQRRAIEGRPGHVWTDVSVSGLAWFVELTR